MNRIESGLNSKTVDNSVSRLRFNAVFCNELLRRTMYIEDYAKTDTMIDG